MNNYEKENAKEWNLDLGNSSTQHPSTGDDSKDEDGQGWTQVVASKKGPQKRFANNAPGPLTSRQTNVKPHTPPINNTRGKGPNLSSIPPKLGAPGRDPNHHPPVLPPIARGSRPPGAVPQSLGRGSNQRVAIPQPPSGGPRPPGAIPQPAGRGSYQSAVIPHSLAKGPNQRGAPLQPPGIGSHQPDLHWNPPSRFQNHTNPQGGVSKIETEENGPQAPRQSQAQSRRPLWLNWYAEDNAARAAFRTRKPHDAVCTVETEKSWDIIEPVKQKLINRCEEIGSRFGTYIRPPQHLRDCNLHVWGTEDSIRRTKIELQDWVSSLEESPYGPREKMQLKVKNEKFARVGLKQNKNHDQMEKKMQEEARKQKYQMIPEEGKDFEFQGIFLWPVEDVNPVELLGPSCEAYDPLRMYNHSYIVWDKQLSSFKVLSNKEAAVKDALLRIEGTMREYVARSSKIYSYYMIQLPKPSNASKDIKMLAGPDPTSKVPHLTGASLSSGEIGDYLRAKRATEQNTQRKMRHALHKIIVRLPLYRGQLRMRAVLGTFALTTFRWPGTSPTVPLFDFIKNIDVSLTKGSLIRDLQCKMEPIELFARCTSADGLLESVSHTYASSNEELTPVYTACFQYQAPELGSIRLEVEFSKPAGGQEIYEETRAQWIKNDMTEASVPLELNMLQVNGGTSWRLHVLSENLVDDTRITPQMEDFADSVVFNDPPPGTRPELTSFKVFKYAPNFRFESFEQKTALRFCHKDRGNWIFELARYDTFIGNIATASGKTQWGASYWNAEWDNTLGANLALGIGQAAKWDPWFSTFFPENPRTTHSGKESGFKDFVDDMKYFAGMLDEMRGLSNDHIQDEGDQIDALFS